jgi:hypothetical protein
VFLALLIPSIDLALRRGVLRAGFGELDSSGKAQALPAFSDMGG